MKTTGYSEVFTSGLLNEANIKFAYIEPPAGGPPFQMILCHYFDGQWQAPFAMPESRVTRSGQIKRVGFVNHQGEPLSPWGACFHYAHQWFSGGTAQMAKDGRCLLFRPADHGRRGEKSSRILCMAVLPTELFCEMSREAVRHNAAYMPRYGTGGRMYLRGLLLGTNPQMGLGPSTEFLAVMMVRPAGLYYPTGLKSKKLLCSPFYDRTAPRGTGQSKGGCNYPGSYNPTLAAKEAGCDEFLYLDPETRGWIQETGSSGFIGLRADKTLITSKGLAVLESITNMSLQTLASELMGFKVEARRFHIKELLVKRGDRRFLESALCGTAARVSPVREILLLGKRGRQRRIIFPNIDDKSGPWCQELHDHLVAIQQGDEKDRWGWTEEVEL